ncbi:MAG TPA: addiction module antidote protein, HigA family [Porphyromonadaceae bacterium]|jgi:addiction module HigA family antidote|nr:addiction module antidote protein, HigA family [Porphyromonadaceae bacterium]HBL34083.1 addiction module antidote protein, HigA family [Porphyromonadaceae bacterium]HBX21467.1 addiction module antidote protein, HigA family [Porphyromonadaceae bacterium]HCM19510.1 addiction module antidote protein, HigA family [Porphyromonadaceae bacterium]
MGNLGYGFCPTHPGELLKEEIEYRHITQSRLAKQMGIPYTALNDILNQRRPLTANTAILFEAALGISADLLMRMQLKYTMQVLRQDKTLSQRLAQIRKMAVAL